MTESPDIGQEGTQSVTKFSNKSRIPPTAIRWNSPVVAAIVLLLGIALFALIRLFVNPLAVLTLAVAIAAALSPIASRLEKHMSRALAVILIYMIIFILFGGLIWLVLPPVFSQVEQVGQRFPEWIQEIQDLYQRWDQISDISISEVLGNQASAISSALVSLPVTISSYLFEFVLILFISLYLLFEGPAIHDFFLSLFPDDRREQVEEVTEGMVQAMGGFVRGIAIISFVIGLLAYIGLSLIGVDFPLVLAIIAGLLEVIPFLGPIIATIPILLVALLESPRLALFALIFWIGVQSFESYVLTPNVMHTQTEISPLMVILAIMFGGALGSLLWVFAAIPLAAALRVLMRKVIAPWLRSKLKTAFS